MTCEKCKCDNGNDIFSEVTIDEIIKWTRITNEIILPALIQILIEIKKDFKNIESEFKAN